MEQDEGHDEDLPSFRAPLPPSDRLWRHPSEIGAITAPTPVVAAAPRPSRPGWLVVLAGGAIGAATAVGLLAMFGVLDREVVERLVVEREAVVPAAATVSVPDGSVAAVVAKAAPTVARVEVTSLIGSATGSAVLFRDDGYLITNAHVVDEATGVTVVLADGTRHDASIIGADADSDVAVVKIKGSGFPIALLGSSADVRVGQPAIAIGSPLGLEGGPSTTVGIISALDRTVDTHDGSGALTGMIQTDASIAAGSSGGGLFDTNGALIGITTAVAVTDSGTEGLGFAIGIDDARAAAEQLVRDGKVTRVWLGIRGNDMTSAAEQGHGTEGGAMVREVVEGGPAATAGLAGGDVITHVGEVEVTSMSGLVTALRSHQPGETVAITYTRGGQPTTVDVVLAEKP